jgi:hypothetical protein
MKNKILNLCSSIALGGFLLAGSAGTAQAQITNTYIQTFDSGGNTTPFAGTGSVAGWFYWYNFFGNVSMTNDPTMDADGNPASGSLMVSIPFTPAGNGQVFYGSFDDQFQYDVNQRANALNFTNITFKIHVQPGTKPDNSGNFGSIGVGLLSTFDNGGTPSITTFITVPGVASNGWVTITAPIDKTAVDINNVGGFFFNYNNFGGFPTNPITFWLDDVALNLGGAPPPPPTLNSETPVAGFNVIDSSSGINDRESIMSTTTTGQTWVGRPGTVTYSYNIASFPDSATYQGFDAYMFLIPGPFDGAGDQQGIYANIPSFETAPDYNETNVFFVDIANGNYNVTNGTTVNNINGVVAHLRYKVNEDHGNNMIYGNAPYTNAPGSGSTNFGSGTILTLNSPVAVGTWSVSFNNNTNVTLTGPGGVSASATFNAFDASQFSDASGFIFLLGSQANSTPAIGQRVVYSSVSIQGVATPVTDNFAADATLNTNLWTLLGSANNGLVVVPATTAYWLDWTLPDIGYAAQQSSTLSGGPTAWSDLGLTPVGQIGSTRRTLIPVSSKPSTTNGFYRLTQRTFTQLQVLLPGETNAPGTLTGKVGTPTPVAINADVPVTINAVDSSWHIIGGVTDIITLTTSDNTAFLPDALPMVNGTVQEIVDFEQAGSFTVTGTDSSNGAITPNTSSAVTAH